MKNCETCGAAILPGVVNYKRKRFCGSACMHVGKRHTTGKSLAAFWARVNKTDGCWLWTGAKNEWGYGLTTWTGAKNLRAHRISYELANGTIPAGLLVMHRCDTPACVNPAHLFLGTDNDNRADCITKERHARGETGRAKLTQDQVREMRRIRKERGIVYTKLGPLFGVSTTQARSICSGINWAHIK